MPVEIVCQEQENADVCVLWKRCSEVSFLKRKDMNKQTILRDVKFLVDNKCLVKTS